MTKPAAEAPVVLITINGSDQEVPDDASVAQLLDHLQLRSQHVAVEVNRELIPRERHANHQLASGDQLEIVTLVGGG